ncbi:MAG: F0F1 ATP synthase subunit A [Nocardioidaceae bacterium]
MSDTVVVAAGKIEIGTHVERHVGGLTFNIDTIWTTLIAGAIVLGLGFWARSKLTKPNPDHVPTKIQLLWETIVKQVNDQVEDSLGRVNPFVVPLAVALFFFILICNWMELVPSEPNHLHLLPSPTADTNLTYALALLVIIGVWTYGIRKKGIKGYLKHFLEPFPVLLPLNLIEELIKPVTLALRLFGNIFAGGIMLSLIGLIPIYVLWAPNLIWKLFDMFIGGIQAFIFALLTVLYFGMAGAGHGDDHETEETAPATHDEPAAKTSKDAEPARAH